MRVFDIPSGEGRGEESNNARPFLAEAQELLLPFALMALEDDILAALTREPGLKGWEIASRLGLDKSLVNSTLYKLRLRKLAWQHSDYRWFLKPANAEPRQTVQPQLDTPLSKLCRYYLQCLSLDDEGDVSLFAQSQHSRNMLNCRSSRILTQMSDQSRVLKA